MFELLIRLSQPLDAAEADQLVTLQVKWKISVATMTQLVIGEDKADMDVDCGGSWDGKDHLRPQPAHKHRPSKV